MSYTTPNDAPWMKWDRSRNSSWPLRKKRSDTHIGTIEEEYDIDLGVRSDMHLWTYLEQYNIESINDLINRK